jgi:UMF1 family MFS transporter
MELFIFGSEFNNSSLLSYSLSFPFFLIVAFVTLFYLELLDYSGNKKRFMQFFLHLGVTFGNEFILFLQVKILCS